MSKSLHFCAQAQEGTTDFEFETMYNELKDWRATHGTTIVPKQVRCSYKRLSYESLFVLVSQPRALTISGACRSFLWRRSLSGGTAVVF